VLIYALPKSIQLPAWVEHFTHADPQLATPPASDVPAQAASAAEPERSAVLPEPASSEPVAAAPAPSAPASAVATLTLDSAGAGGVSPSSSPDPRLVDAATAPTAGSPAATPSATGSVSLMASESAWVEIRDARGQKVLSRHVVAGESLALEGEAPLTLRIGNAAAVQLSFRGQPVDLVPHTRSNVARLELK
jgi:cytoskeleton protein RodZ